MAQLKDLIVNGDAHFGNGATVNGNLQADSYNSRIMLSTTAKPTPSSSGTGIVTENYLAWALSGGKAQTPATTITTNPTVTVSTAGVITGSYSSTKSVTPTVTAGWVTAGTAGTIRVTGSTTSQLTTRNSGSLTVSSATVTAPAGYYAAAATKSVASGSASTPATTITTNPTISVSTSGVITASYSGTKSVTPTVSAGYVSAGTAGTIRASGSTTSQLTTRNSGSLSNSGATVTAPAGYYAAAATKAVTMTGTYLFGTTAAAVRDKLASTTHVWDMTASNTLRYVYTSCYDYFRLNGTCSTSTHRFSQAAWGLNQDRYYASMTVPTGFHASGAYWFLLGTNGGNSSVYIALYEKLIYHHVDNTTMNGLAFTASDGKGYATGTYDANGALNGGGVLYFPSATKSTEWCGVLVGYWE